MYIHSGRDVCRLNVGGSSSVSMLYSASVEVLECSWVVVVFVVFRVNVFLDEIDLDGLNACDPFRRRRQLITFIMLVS